MTNRVIDFYFFTGTGNTLLVVKEMREAFLASNIEVNLIPIEKACLQKVDLSHTLGLAFPVACQSTFPLVWDFLHSLPDSSGTEVFMVDTLDTYSGGVVGPLKKVLQDKGYETIGAREVRMPGNWLPKKINGEKNALRIKKGLKKAHNYAREIMDGSARWIRFPILSDLMYGVSSMRKTWEFMASKGKKFTVDREKCRQCDICERLCPIDNVVLEEYPRFLGHCQQCMRCISFCPTQAIYVPGKEYEVYRAVKVKELLGAGAEETNVRID